ncbi:chitinase [Streptomyces sp. MS06]|uniref:chitinase n=1 Tax=Streptomyces sp. MS06 TaxID=3385974 RepID=UPI0039A1C269
MRTFPLTWVSALVCLLALTAAGSAPEPGAGRASTRAASSTTGYAPYVSATAASANDAAGAPTAYHLAFVVSDGSGCTPTWNGTDALGDPAVASRIARLTGRGAALRVSFGGSSGEELASACGSASALAQAYGTALDAAGADQADFDVEGGEPADARSVARRSAAVARLQWQRPGLAVSFTLPVMPYGLDGDAVALLESAEEHGVRVSAVNLMTMDYADSYTGDMGDYAVAAATAAHAQLRRVFGLSEAAAWREMALTSMIGANDVAGETFTLADAARVRAFAERNGMAWVSMWASFRDRQCGDGPRDAAAGTADGGGGDDGGGGADGRGGAEDAAEDGGATDPATNCSGVQQEAGAFARALSGMHESG